MFSRKCIKIELFSKHHLHSILSFLFYKRSLCGYGSAFAFKDLVDADISRTETFVRNELPTLLKAAEDASKTPCDISEKACFFGPYAIIPEKFQFGPGDIKIIHGMARHVKRIVDEETENKGLEHFADMSMVSKKNSAYEKNLVQTVFGLAFGSQIKKRQTDDENFINKQQILFKKAQAIFKKYESDEIVPIRPFLLNMVEVKSEKQKIKGTVMCTFCKETGSGGVVSVFWKSPGTWVVANLETHMKKKHLDTDLHENPCPIKISSKNSINVHNDHGDSNAISNDTCSYPADSSTISLVVESCEDILYSQLSTQNIKMKNCSVRNKEKVITKNLGLHLGEARKTHATKYCKIPGNGDCFFLSIAHQLHNVVIGTEEHEQKALQLRQMVVAHIKQPENFSSYLHDLKNRIQIPKKASDSEINEACIIFLDNKLSKSGTWAGMESMRAISEIEKVNVVVLNDDGTSHLPSHFNKEANKCVMLLFGSATGKVAKTNMDRLHYDSIVGMDLSRISMMAKEITDAETKHMNFVGEASNRSLIEV